MPLARRLAKATLAPVRRILDPRFHDIAHRLHLTRQDVWRVDEHVGGVNNALLGVGNAVNDVRAEVDTRLRNANAAQVEAVTMVGQELRVTQTAVTMVGQELRVTQTGFDEGVKHLAQHLEGLSSQLGVYCSELDGLICANHERSWSERIQRLATNGTPADLNGADAQLLNYAGSHRGFAAQAGLWMNPPLVLEYTAGDVHLSNVNERIVEIPFAMRALGDVAIGGRVLDFGSSESTVALSLATMGFDVTALDLREYSFTHPNLTVRATPLEEFDAEAGSFDAVLVISTVEHVGLGWYGEQPGRFDDLRAMKRLHELLKPGGTLVLTVPYGAPSIDDLQRRYDHAGLDALLKGFEEVERMVLERASATQWVTAADSDARAVALVRARRAS